MSEPAAAEGGHDGAPRGADVLSEPLIGALRAFLARRAGSPEDAEDLLQECLLRVHSGIAHLRDGERMLAWVHRIARNLLADQRRTRRPEPLDDELPEPDDAPDQNAVVAGWLEPAIADLDAPYRDVLRLSELEGVPHREIAERLGLSVSGVKSRVQRGRAQLRARIVACCELEFDRRGGIVDYRRRHRTCCGDPPGADDAGPSGGC